MSIYTLSCRSIHLYICTWSHTYMRVFFICTYTSHTCYHLALLVSPRPICNPSKANESIYTHICTHTCYRLGLLVSPRPIYNPAKANESIYTHTCTHTHANIWACWFLHGPCVTHLKPMNQYVHIYVHTHANIWACWFLHGPYITHLKQRNQYIHIYVHTCARPHLHVAHEARWLC